MKKLLFGIIGLLALYLIFNYVATKNVSGIPEDQPGPSDLVEADRAHVMTEQARADAFNSTSSLILVNDTRSDILVKVMKLSDNSEYMTFMLSNGQQTETNILADEYYLKMRYYEDKKYSYQRGDPFKINDNEQTTITMEKVVFGNYGSSSISPSDF